MSTFYDSRDRPYWVNPHSVECMYPSDIKGYVWVQFSNAFSRELSPFKPQERNDEAFMQALTSRTTLNEAFLALGTRNG